MERPFPELRAVAFDLDDTLFDREAAVRSLLRTWLGKVSPETMCGILRLDGRGHAPRGPFFAWLQNAFPGLGGDLWTRFRAEIPAHIEVDPAARQLLERLAASGLSLGLLTNGGTVHQTGKLQATGLAGFFPPERILISAAMGVEKPDPMAFAALAAALGERPARILFIGDHPETDIAGAKNAGLTTCWLRRRDAGGMCGEADLVIDSLAEIIPLFSPSA